MQGLVITDCKNEMLLDPVNRMLGISDAEREIVNAAVERAWSRCLYCFDHINNPRFHAGGVQLYHTVQYSMFLYFLENEIFESFIKGKNGNMDAQNICDKLLMANMSIAGVDLFYEQRMPDIFLMAHTSGAVITPRAQFGNYFMFMQGCNVGYSKGYAPVLGEGVIMWGNSKIIGNCHVGNHVMFGANTYIKDMDIPDNSIVFGQYPNIIIKENREDEVMENLRTRFIL